jgi:8-oxoguanine deaminase
VRESALVLTVRGAAMVWDGTGPAGPDVTCVDGRVVDGPVAGEVLDASGCVVTPGLVNAHHHLLQTAFRTLPGTRGVPMGDWLPRMAAGYAAVGVDDELVHAAAAAGLAEALLCGVTTVADHHLTWPASAGDGVGLARATAAAAAELGARLVFVRGSARDDPETAAASAEAIAHALGGEVQVAVGPAGVHSDGPETFRLLGEVAARHGLRRRTQANEQVDVEVAAARYGRRPLELLDEWGWLAPDVTLAHLCGVTGGEVDRVAAAGVSATHAPGCDLPMGWGVAPAAALADAGVAVGLGTSGGGSNDAGHLLADARLALQVAPLAGRPVAAAEVLRWATAGAADGLGRPELGRLTPGSAADLACWDVTGVADAGVVDPLAGLLWAGPGRRAKHVVVGGQVVVRDGELVGRGEREIAGALAGLLRVRPSR